MSYCVECGVKLEPSLTNCPLCHTKVINPNITVKEQKSFRSPFPTHSGDVEMPTAKDLSIFISVFFGTIALLCGILNIFFYNNVLWSMPPIGVCVSLWVLLIPVSVWRSITIYTALFLNGVSFILLEFLISLMRPSKAWFYEVGLPITAISTLYLMILFLVWKKSNVTFLSGILAFFLYAGLQCVTIEVIVDLFVNDTIQLGWSVIVSTICLIVSVSLITILSRSRLRNTVRKRLHF